MTRKFVKRSIFLQVLRPGALGRPRGIRRRGRWEGGSGWGIHVKPWLILVNVWQKPLQYCKVISLQLIKKNRTEQFLIFHWFDKIQSLKRLKIIYDPWNTTEPSQLLHGPAALVSPRSCYECRIYQDQNLNQNLHFNLIPRWFMHIGKFKKLSFRITKTRI